MFSCEFCEISKNTFFTEYLYATASVHVTLLYDLVYVLNDYVPSNINENYLINFPCSCGLHISHMS